MKEFSKLIFTSALPVYVITHCIVLESLEMSVNLTDNVFPENNQ